MHLSLVSFNFFPRKFEMAAEFLKNQNSYHKKNWRRMMIIMKKDLEEIQNVTTMNKHSKRKRKIKGNTGRNHFHKTGEELDMR